MSKSLLIRRHSIGTSIDMSLYENQYLTTKALNSGTITFTISSQVSTSNVTNVSYRKNSGEWVTTANSSSEVVITVDVATNDIIEWKGNATCYCAGGSFESSSHWGGTASFDVYGNLMSMLYDVDFRGKSAYPSTKIRATQHMFSASLVVDATNLILPATTCYGQAYMCLFDNCTSLIYPPAVLPAPIIKSAMYYCMFRGCTSMTTMPTISAEAIDTAGSLQYQSMFSGCSALQYNTQQTIHVGIARAQCCQYMFQNCTSMVNAPNVDCTDIVSGATFAFAGMFRGCTNLQTPPERFDVDTAEHGIFNITFANCSSLQYAPIINIRNVGSNTYGAFATMFGNCTSLTNGSGINIYFAEDSEWNGELTFSEMFYGCTSMIQGPSIHVNGRLITKSSKTLYELCYNCQNMENHDIELNYVIDSSTTITTGANYSNANMFYYCLKLKESPRITRLTLRDYEFYRAFDGDTQLRDVYVKFNTNTASNALNSWLANTGSLSGIRAVHQAGSLSLPDNSTSGIPSKWVLDQGDWTATRHARMSLYIFNFPGGGVTESYIDSVLDDPDNFNCPLYHYYGDTLTISNTTYFVWENDYSGDSDHSKLLTTTDNFYELTKQSLTDSYNFEDENLGKTYDWIYGILRSTNEIYYDSQELDDNGWYLISVFRNQ